MPVQKSHSRLQPQIPRVDELPSFVPDPSPVPAGPSQRGPDGRFVKGNGIASKGGRASRQVQRHLHTLGLEWLTQDVRPALMRKGAISQLRAEQRWVASTVGGGVLDPLAAAELRNAVTLETIGHLLMEVPKLAGDDLAAGISLGGKLLTSARGHRLAAIELSARGAAARLQQGNGGRRADFGAIDVSGELAALQKLLGEGKDAPPVVPEVSTDEGEGDEQ